MVMKQALICLWSAVLLSCLVSGLLGQDTESRIQQLYSDARSEEQGGDLNAAIEKYKAILELDPKLTAAYNNLGRLYLRQARYSEAIEALKHALQLDEKLAPAHALMGMSLYEIENYSAAERESREAVRLDPRDQNAKLYLARSLYELGKFDEAAGLLKELARGDPADPQHPLQPRSRLYEACLLGTGETPSRGPGLISDRVDSGNYSGSEGAVWRSGRTLQTSHCQSAEYTQSALRLRARALPKWRFQGSPKGIPLELQINPYSYMACWEAARILINDEPSGGGHPFYARPGNEPQFGPGFLVRGRALLQLKRARQVSPRPEKSLRRLTRTNPRSTTNSPVSTAVLA